MQLEEKCVMKIIFNINACEQDDGNIFLHILIMVPIIISVIKSCILCFNRSIFFSNDQMYFLQFKKNMINSKYSLF